MNNTASKKRLLYVAATARHLFRFHVPYIRALGEEADVYLMADGKEMEVDFQIPFRKRMVSLQNLFNVFRIRRILRQYRFDAVILNTTLAAFLVRAAMLGMRRRPYVCNIVHGFLFDLPLRGLRNFIFYASERMMWRLTDSMAVMNVQDFYAANRAKLCRGEVTFLYGMGATLPTKPPIPNPALRSSFSTPEELLLTFVGEFREGKGHPFLIHACRVLRQRGLPVRLLLLGDGPLREVLIRDARRLGVEAFVTAPGNCEGVMPYLAVTDIYVSASRKEGLPFNVLEAMSCGLPLLISNIKGQSDLMECSEDFLFALDDMIAFCNGIERIYRSGNYGVGAVCYSTLDVYRMEEVFSQNLSFMKKGWS